jgi:hypothetical protein
MVMKMEKRLRKKRQKKKKMKKMKKIKLILIKNIRIFNGKMQMDLKTVQ